MKVFAYDKKDNHKVAEINNVDIAFYKKDKQELIIEDEDGNKITFDIRYTKVTLYQN